MGILETALNAVSDLKVAEILKAQIQLLERQKNDVIQERDRYCQRLESALREVENLKVELAQAKEELRLKAKVLIDASVKTPNPITGRLNTEEERVLMLLSKAEESPASFLASTLGQNIQAVRFYLQELLNKEFVLDIHTLDGMESCWILKHEGRAYLMKHNLLDVIMKF